MIRRIELIKYKAPKANNLFAGSCSSPNAYYDFSQHEFTICPQLLQTPDASLQMIIAHELGHSIDPCIASYPLEKHSGKQKPVPGAEGAAEARKIMLEKMSYVDFNPKVPQQSSDLYSSFESESVNEMYQIAYENHQVTRVLEGIPLTQNPFESVITCLKGGGSVAARMGDIAGAKKNVLENMSNLRASGASEAHPQMKALQETLNRLNSHYVEKEACGYMGIDEGPSQMQEAFSDWMATEVIANKMNAIGKAGDTEKAKQIAFEANGIFVATSCESVQLDLFKSITDALSQAGCIRRTDTLNQDLENMSRQADEHPENHARASRIFMAHPEINLALGCKQPFLGGAKRCE